ncbi:uncharacterized protein [Rutidosis leptorrhynchoides]|uniref:uncharacterized protein isoform X2 n=1 Tax=Rutidosis leptorrhynchoides TaxID=125765 RepID=UPI003A9A0022
MITILFLIGSDSSIWLRGEPTLKGNGSCYIQEERPCKSIGIGCSSTPDETLISMDAHQKQATNASKDNVAQHQSNMSASTSTSGTGTKSRKRYSKEKAKDADRRRRIRIAAAIDSLESSLPLSHGGNKTDIVDKCVDYIKSLQHHLKELSQNRLGGEPTSNHMMHLEEYGHFLVNESTTSGPLDDIIGKLLDENPSEAAMLLKTRSFYDAYCS